MTTALMAEETLPPLKEGRAPQNFEELWKGFDPRKEPLDVEVLKEWEEDGVVLQVLRYRIGVFKGKKAMMAAVYGYPKGGSNLPGLLQIHGGGQYADYRACLSNGKRGYATISIAWAGRINAPDYKVDPSGVKLFWAGKTEDPNYKLTTDWGVLDAYHAPSRNPKNNFVKSTAPYPWTLDAVDSPRNSPWFLCAIGARRALTFLEKQPQVDPSRLGVYGHSMGGKITVLTAGSDSRIKAAAPSCGGLSNRNTKNALFDATIADDVYLRNITCPIAFLSPANDFHGRIDDQQKAYGEIKSTDWRVTHGPHHNHQDTEAYMVVGPLWFDQHLKASFEFPKTPAVALELKADTPSFAVTPAPAKKILSVDVFYTQQGVPEPGQNDREHAINRFWHHAHAEQSATTWTAELPLLTTDKPLWVYANVLYPLEKPISGAGYYYGLYTAKTFNLSSKMEIAAPDQLKAAGVKATFKPTLLIEDFKDDWEKEWFTYDRSHNWGRKTHKVYNPKWQAPTNAQLAFDVRCERPNKMVVTLDHAGAEIELTGGDTWQSVVLSPADFTTAEDRELQDWKGIMELRLMPQDTLKAKDKRKRAIKHLGEKWKGPNPEFRNLRWIGGE